MQSIRRSVTLFNQNPNYSIGIRSLSTSSDPASLKKNIASLLDSLSLKPGGALVQNCGDSEVGKIVIELAKERKVQTISIIDDKPGASDIIEELKDLGGDIVVPESYTKTWGGRGPTVLLISFGVL
ncbi:trans-2-enoyl-CoA reductase, mitochondrial-like [Thalictrum thalictroides]|uniref:Trans-2-enoyl-CoA reductase, mitochondrial-like n=1 Tax=Thalictrum thalictroides TaxID=46969 RepID=A0A7J6W6D6_THATH|nr:trans-2-enoyl-CoA reductase, mitochondrial-like [Thalictrum thalictroides]